MADVTVNFNIDYQTQLNYQLLYYAESMCRGMCALAIADVEWLQMIIPPIWFPRYIIPKTRISKPHPFHRSKSYINQVLIDILFLLEMIDRTGDERLISIPEVTILRKIKEDWLIQEA